MASRRANAWLISDSLPWQFVLQYQALIFRGVLKLVLKAQLANRASPKERAE